MSPFSQLRHTRKDTGQPQPEGETSQSEAINFTEVRRRIWQLSGPALTEMLFLTLMNVINMIMVGHLGPESISAVGLSNQPFFLMNAIFVAFNVGTTALVARCVGANQVQMARHYTRQSLLLTIPLGLALSGLAVFFAPKVIYFMGGRGETLRLGSAYFAIAGSSLILLSVTAVVLSALRGAGDTRTPMKISMIANFFVVLFGWLLIYGHAGIPAMGVVGAGYALLLARVVMAGLALWAITRSGSAVGIRLRGNYRPDWPRVKEIMSIGLPSAVEQLVLQGGLILYVRIVAGLGAEVYAAHQILLNILGFSFQPGMAFSIAASTLVGQNLGANNPRLAEISLKEVRKIGLTLTAFVAVALLTMGKLFMRIYTSDPQVIDLGASVIKFLAVLVPAQTSMLITVGGLRGAGDTRFPLYVSAFGVWVVRLGLAHLCVEQLGWGLHGAWVSLVTDQYIRSALIGYRFHTGRWKTIMPLSQKVKPAQKTVCAH